MMTEICLGLAAALSASGLVSSDSSECSPLIHRIEITAGSDYVASSISDDLREDVPANEKISVNTSLPVDIRYAFSFTNSNIPYYLPGGYQGIGAGVLNLGVFEKDGLKKSRSFIGYPVRVYLFQGGPFWHVRRNISLDYEWNFGATFGWKPYSPINEKFNLTVGSRVNAYLNLGLNLKFQLTPHSGLFLGLGVSHYSNGNTSWPNPGVNTFGLRAGFIWTLNPLPEVREIVDRSSFQEETSENSRKDDIKEKKKPEYDLTFWGSSRKRVYRGGEEPVLLPGHYGCAGISFAPMFRFGKWWRIGGSADLQWDGSSDKKHAYISGTTTEDIKFRHPDFFRQISFGISAHGELQMPVFAVNVGMGYNLFSPVENRGFYQNLTLKTFVVPRVYINIGYQLRNFYQQSSLMLGLGFVLN